MINVGGSLFNATPNSDTVDGSEILRENQLIRLVVYPMIYKAIWHPANLLRLVVYPIIYKVLAPSQVVSRISEPSIVCHNSHNV